MKRTGHDSAKPRNPRFKPITWLTTIDSQEQERRQHVADGQQARGENHLKLLPAPQEEITAGDTTSLATRLIDSVGGLSAWDDTRSPELRQKYGKRRIAAAVFAGAALVTAWMNRDKIVEVPTTVAAAVADYVVPKPPVNDFADSEAFRHAVANYTGEAPNIPSDADDGYEEVVIGPNGTVWGAVRAVQGPDADIRPTVDEIMHTQPSVLDGVDPGDVIRVPVDPQG